MTVGNSVNSDGFTVTPVTSRRDLMAFIKYPLRLYRNDPCFVPHLLSERKEFFGPGNPLFEFTDVTYLLARDARGDVVGRVTAHINHRHNEFTGESTGFFGFFECAERLDVARALLQATDSWLGEKGMTVVRGPFNFSTNEECGFLVDGFDKPPVFMMPYTKPYYVAFVEELGYTHAKDLLAYDCTYQGHIPEHLERFSERARERMDIKIRKMDMSRFELEVETVFNIYNSAWERNWGFVPMTRGEFKYAAKGLKPIVDPAIALIAEKEGEPVGFSLSLPDYNKLLRTMKGRLLPFGFLHLLLGKRSINRVRVILLGIIPQYRNRGIDALLYYETFKRGLEKGYTSCEISWVLEDNVMMDRAARRMGAVPYKRYRIYEKKL
jgi:GNAT superfamily N-acetyltransferase